MNKRGELMAIEHRHPKQITWLHLSDLHLGHYNYDEEVIVSSMLEDIGRQIEECGHRIDFVLITGDITYSGQKEQFQIAEKFLADITKICGISNNDIIIVPGNHDITRGDVSQEVRTAAYGIKSRKEVSSIIGDEKERAVFSSGLKNYRDFLERNFEWARGKGVAPLSYTINRKVGDIKVSILALNSAWMAYGMEAEKGGLILGERQVREAIQATDDPQISIAMMHHPFEWLKWFDSMDVKGMLQRRVDFILNGHEHNVEIIGQGSLFGNAFQISAGAVVDNRDDPCSYNITNCNFENGLLTCYLRHYEDSKGGFWAEDNSIDSSVTNGVVQTKISDRLMESISGQNPQNKWEENSSSGNHRYWVNPHDCVMPIDLPPIPHDLIRTIRERNCVVFVGGGASMDAGLPSWSELLKTMIEGVEDRCPLSADERSELDLLMNQQSYGVVAEYCKEKLGSFAFAKIIRENLSIRNKVSETQKVLARIPFAGAVTTNYDRFIESYRNCCNIVLPEDIATMSSIDMESFFDDEFFPVFKIHGSCEKPRSIILTDSDYRHAIFTKEAYRNNLRKLFQKKTLLFVGFSFRDPSINLLLQEILTVSEGNEVPHYAFLSDVGTIMKKHYFNSMNINVIPYRIINGSHVALRILLNELERSFEKD